MQRKGTESKSRQSESQQTNKFDGWMSTTAATMVMVVMLAAVATMTLNVGVVPGRRRSKSSSKSKMPLMTLRQLQRRFGKCALCTTMCAETTANATAIATKSCNYTLQTRQQQQRQQKYQQQLWQWQAAPFVRLFVHWTQIAHHDPVINRAPHIHMFTWRKYLSVHIFIFICIFISVFYFYFSTCCDPQCHYRHRPSWLSALLLIWLSFLVVGQRWRCVGAAAVRPQFNKSTANYFPKKSSVKNCAALFNLFMPHYVARRKAF